jgi:hypothetical protein
VTPEAETVAMPAKLSALIAFRLPGFSLAFDELEPVLFFENFIK